MRYTISLVLASLLASTATAEVPRVVTDIPPVHSLVAQVMGDLGAPELLLDRGASEHGFQLRPSQAASLQDAGLVVWVGPELTPWLEGALAGAPSSVPRLGLLGVEGLAVQDYGQAGAAHDDHAHEAEEAHADHAHDAEEAHADHAHETEEAHADHAHEDHAHEDHAHETGADHAGHAHETAEEHAAHAGEEQDAHAGHDHDHDHAGTDPHAWMNPSNAQVWLAAIAAELSRLDPDNAATYAANSEAAAAAIAALDAEVAATLAPVADTPLVMFHDAYGYLATHYGLNIAGTVALGDAASPGAARLRDLQATVSEGGAVCLFPEAQHAPDLLTQMADGTGARIAGVLDPVGSTAEPGPQMYAEWLRGMAATIAACAQPS